MGKKQLTREVLLDTPSVTPPNFVARVVASRGKNLFDVVLPDKRETLALLPPRFRNLIWVKRGHFVVVDPTDVAEKGGKVEGEIVHVLYPEHVKELKRQGIWPVEFDDNQNSLADEKSDESESDDNDIFVNNNRAIVEESDSEEESDNQEYEEESENEGMDEAAEEIEKPGKEASSRS
ncbi:uncharacterized protein VTP21DRAFT_682 [Calcarisporiella thermophila]|uniref:uncharacterized protein n=1 Tax=Calcarisporiella thermophila TaxID=911321 RepID=UPI003744AE59